MATNTVYDSMKIKRGSVIWNISMTWFNTYRKVVFGGPLDPNHYNYVNLMGFFQTVDQCFLRVISTDMEKIMQFKKIYNCSLPKCIF
jgi:hypothetical protein